MAALGDFVVVDTEGGINVIDVVDELHRQLGQKASFCWVGVVNMAVYI